MNSIKLLGCGGNSQFPSVFAQLFSVGAIHFCTQTHRHTHTSRPPLVYNLPWEHCQNHSHGGQPMENVMLEWKKKNPHGFFKKDPLVGAGKILWLLETIALLCNKCLVVAQLLLGAQVSFLKLMQGTCNSPVLKWYNLLLLGKCDLLHYSPNSPTSRIVVINAVQKALHMHVCVCLYSCVRGFCFPLPVLEIMSPNICL